MFIVGSALSLSNQFTGTPLKYLETDLLNITNWQEATSWLFTSMTKDLNLAWDDREQIQEVAREGLATGLRVQRAGHLAMLPPLSKL